MGRISIVADPMVAFRKRTIANLNRLFGVFDSGAERRERAWADKRKQAQSALSGGEVASAFVGEADLRNMTVREFAEFILGKADVSDRWRERELQRQEYMLRVDRATSRDELDSIEREARELYGR